MNSKGDMSISVIVVAAIALIILVVLVAIFTGRIGIFNQGVKNVGDAELVTMKISYGSCHPTSGAETSFKTQFGAATTDPEKDSIRASFKQNIDACKNLDKNGCVGSCAWE